VRSQSFLNTINDRMDFNLQRVEYFMTNANFRGGWEGWLQANIGHAFSLADPNNIMTRELPYSSENRLSPYLQYDSANNVVADVGNAAMATRADFCISREQGIKDTTYFELKCKLSSEMQAEQWNRFASDINKLTSINDHLVQSLGRPAPYNCIAILATHGVFQQLDINNIRALWEHGRSAYVLDYRQTKANRLTNLSGVRLGGQDGFFLVAVAM